MEVEWKAFQIRPGVPLEGMPRVLKPGERNELSPGARQLSEEIGLKMKRPTFIACSRPALESAEYAKEQGKFDEFHLAVFKAYWEDNRNIGLRDVLRDIAGSCGLDADELERCLDERIYADRIDVQNLEARELGINGVPAYVIRGRIIEGAQPYEVFQHAVSLEQFNR